MRLVGFSEKGRENASIIMAAQARRLSDSHTRPKQFPRFEETIRGRLFSRNVNSQVAKTLKCLEIVERLADTTFPEGEKTMP